MKDYEEIDELLNAYIDGELTRRGQTEVSRLVSNDPEIALRLEQLEKCRELVGSLPEQEPPEFLVEDVKSAVERRALLGKETQQVDKKTGVRDLLLRKVLSYAAMIALIGGLGFVIYSILGPVGGTGDQSTPVASRRVEESVRMDSSSQVGNEKSGIKETAEFLVAKSSEQGDNITSDSKALKSGGGADVVSADTVTARERSVTSAEGFTGRLELVTSDPVAVESIVGQSIEENDRIELAGPQSGIVANKYIVCGSLEGVVEFVRDLGQIWNRVDDARLYVDSIQGHSEFLVRDVQQGQLIKIFDQSEPEDVVKVARDMSRLNRIAAFMPGRQIAEFVEIQDESFVGLPKPVLTSGVEISRKLSPKIEKAAIQLSIEVTGPSKNVNN